MIGIDIGGTTTRVGDFNTASALEYTLLAHFPTHANYADQMVVLHGVLAQAGAVAGIGVALGGRIARDGGSVAVAPNLRDYEGQPLRDALADRWGCPVTLAHDTVCGLLAERRLGALRRQPRCAYLTVSTGTGAAVALDQQLLSIEFGHQLLVSNDRPCLCGQIGCLETSTGGRQIERFTGLTPDAIDNPDFWQVFTAMLATGLVNLAHLTRVEVVALSGGILLHRPQLLVALQAQVLARLRGALLALVPAALGADAPLVGAAQLLADDDATTILH